MSYHDTIMRQEHDYGDIIQSVNFEEDTFKEIDSDHLKKGLTRFFNQSREFQKGWENRKARIVGERLAKGQFQEIPFSKNDALQLVIDAIELGYLWDFKLQEPWHPAIFFDENRITTLPWQHQRAVLYTGRSEYEFYSKEFLEENQKYLELVRRNSGIDDLSVDDLHNAESVLRTGYFNPGVQWAQDEKEANKKMEKSGDQTRAFCIFLSIRIGRFGDSQPASYAGHNGYDENYSEPVLEVELPTKFLRMPYNFRSGQFISSTREFFNQYSRTSQFDPKEIQYTNHHGTGHPVLPLDYVNGVWDVRATEHPYFIPLDEYVKKLQSHIGGRLPDNIKIENGAEKGHFRRKSNQEIMDQKWCHFGQFLKDHTSLETLNNYLMMSAKNIRNIKVKNTKSEILASFKRLMSNLNKFKLYRKPLKEYNYDFSINSSIELNHLLLDNNIKEIENFSSLAQKLEVLKRIELEQNLKNERNYNKVEREFQAYLKQILSVEVNQESLMGLAKSIAENNEEFKMFRNLILKEEDPEKYQKIIYEKLDEFLRFVINESKLASELIKEFEHIARSFYTIKNKETITGHKTSAERGYRNIIPSLIRFEIQREKFLRKINDSDIELNLKTKNLTEYFISNKSKEIFESARLLQENFSKLEDLENLEQYADPEKIAEGKNEEGNLEENFVLLLSLDASRENVLELFERLAENREQFQKYKKEYDIKLEDIRD